MTDRNRILVVDDSPINLSIIEELLQDRFDITTAENGEEGIRLALETGPDLILLDIMMPGIDGYETCRRLRDEPDLDRPGIILVSAKALQAERVAGYQAGADDYITKPFELTELEARVELFIRFRNSERREHRRAEALWRFQATLQEHLAGVDAALKGVDETVAADVRKHVEQIGVEVAALCREEVAVSGPAAGDSDPARSSRD